MRKGSFILFLLILGCARAQFFQYGIQGGFLGKQTVVFDKPVILDSNLLYHDSVYALATKLHKTNSNYPVSLDLYLNYHLSKHYYIGFNYRYMKQLSYRNGINDDYNPSITVSAHSFGLTGGYTLRLDRFNLFAEAGLAATRLKFKYGWIESDRTRAYSNYLDQKNTLLMGFGKVGFTYMCFSLSTRMDVRAADIRNKSGIKTLKYTPTLNVGFHIRSGTSGKKKFRNDANDVQLDEDVAFKETFEFPRLSGAIGWFLDVSRFRTTGAGTYAYLYQLSTVKLQLNQGWTSFNNGPSVMLKYAPFRHRHFILVGGVHASYGGNSVKIGKMTISQIAPNGNSVETKVTDIKGTFTNYQFNFAAGYQVKVSDISYIEITPLVNFIYTELDYDVGSGGNVMLGFLKWKRGFSINYGLNVSYVKRHWGVSLRALYETKSLELNNRLQPMQYVTLSAFRYAPLVF